MAVGLMSNKLPTHLISFNSKIKFVQKNKLKVCLIIRVQKKVFKCLYQHQITNYKYSALTLRVFSLNLAWQGSLCARTPRQGGAVFVYILGNITRRAAPALSRILKNQRGARRHCVNPSSSITIYFPKLFY